MRSTIAISPDWEFIRTRKKGGKTFTLLPTNGCPGYELNISNWCLRADASSEKRGPVTSEELATLLVSELERVLPSSAFEEPPRPHSGTQELAIQPVGLSAATTSGPTNGDASDDFRSRFVNVMYRYFLSPSVALLSVPLVTLAMRNRTRYFVEKVEWPFSAPPRLLQHLATTGFDCRFPFGILAVPESGTNVWVVRSFSQCEVELKYDSTAALKNEFPWLAELGGVAMALKDIKKNTDQIPVIHQMVDRAPQRTAAFLKGTIKQKLGTLGTVIEKDFTASPHFRNLTWRGNQYVLKVNAAVIVETLYIAQKHYGIPGMHQNEVFAQVYGSNKKNWPSSQGRIHAFFRTKDAKRLWDDGLIDHDGKGNFSLKLNLHTHTQ